MGGKKDVRKGKVGKPAKDIIPVTLGKPPREGNIVGYPDVANIQRSHDYQPPKLAPVWPGDEAALNHDFGLNSGVVFEGDNKITFPKSFYDFVQNDTILWRLPEEVVQMNEVPSRFSKRYGSVLSRPGTQAQSGVFVPAVSQTLLDPNISVNEVSIEEAEKAMAIVTYFEREETEEEFELRKQAEEEKLAQQKKRGKHEEIHIGTVKQVRLSNIEMGKDLPQICKWLSSQLQILKDIQWQDPETKQPIWKKIYPQIDGIPVYNPAGKYWVKMWLFGQERLVEIDSKVPITLNGALLLPRSCTIRDLWPILLSKAFFKLYSFRWHNLNQYLNNYDDEIDGSFIYSLTGYLPQKFSMEQVKFSDWDMLQNQLSDFNWENRRNFISVHCLTQKQPYIPSMSYRSLESGEGTNRSKLEPTQDPIVVFEDGKRGNENSAEQQKRRKLRTTGQVFRDIAGQALRVVTGKQYEFQEKKRPCYVIPGFGYLLFETFANPEDFDLKRIQKREKIKQEDEAKTALLRAKATSPARRLKKHQSPARLREFQKRKARREKEKEERRQKLLEQKICKIFRLLKIKTSVTNVPVLNITNEFTFNEIEEAKLRLLNRDFFIQRDIEQLERLLDEEDRELFDPPDSYIDEDDDRQLAYNPFEDESLAKPQKRVQGGVWVSLDDFPFAFQEYVVYNSISHYDYKLFISDLWENTQQVYYPNEKYEVWVVDIPEEYQSDRIELFVAFSPLLPDKLLYQPQFINFILQLYDFENEQPLEWDEEVKLTTTSVLGYKLDLKADFYALKAIKNCVPCGYVAWINSTVPVTTMSKFQYLHEKLGWHQNSVQLDYPGLLAKGYFIICKLDIKSETEDLVALKLSFADNYLSQFCQLSIVDKQEDPYELNQKVWDINSLQSKRWRPKASEKGYRLILQAIPPLPLPENTIKLEYLTQVENQLKVVQLEQLDPVEYSEKYNPNKYGIILQEHLFIGEETSLSAFVRLRIGGMVAAGGKGKDAQESDEHPPKQERVTILELFEGDNLIYSSVGYNHAYMSHINLQNNGQEFLLVYRYDLRHWPEAIHLNEENQDLNWIMRIFSSDTVAFCKDTRKEDKEESIRKSWEAAQPGRAELAKQTRARYLAQQKQFKGEELTPQEQELVKETYQERRKAKKEQAEGAKGKQPPARGKVQVVETVVEEIKEIPQPEDHVIQEVKEFLAHVHSQRLIYKQDDSVSLLSTEDLESIKSECEQDVKNFEEMYQQKQQKRESFKGFIAEQKNEFRQKLAEQKQKFEELTTAYKQNRDGYNSRVEKRKEISEKLNTVLAGTDLKLIEDTYNEAVSIHVNQKQINTAFKTITKLRIQRYTEGLRKALTDNNYTEMKNFIDLIYQNKLEYSIDNRVITKCKKLILRGDSLQRIIDEPQLLDLEDIQDIIDAADGMTILESLSQQAKSNFESEKKRRAEEMLQKAIDDEDKETISQILQKVENLPVDPELVAKAKELLIEES